MQKAMQTIIDQNAEAGQHYFSPTAVRFFDARFDYGVYGDSVFIESTQYHSGHEVEGRECSDKCDKREYRVCEQRSDGRIEVLHRFPTLDMASVQAEIEVGA